MTLVRLLPACKRGQCEYLVVSALVVRSWAIVASSRLLAAVVSTSGIRASVTVAVAPTVLVVAATVVT